MEPNDQEDLANNLLNAALKRYSSAEPRAGLEGRVLANLRAEHGRLGRRVSLWVSLAAIALVGTVAATIFLVWRPDVKPQIVATHAVAGVIAKKTITGSAERKQSSVRRRSHVFARGRRQAMASPVSPADDGPKLDQFPSPRPLSEQEKMLARYVQERPQEARLIARAQAELLQQDLLAFGQNNSPQTPDSMR